MDPHFLMRTLKTLTRVNLDFFARFLFLANSVKRHICDVNNSQLGDFLPFSVNKRMVSPFCESFSFTELRTCEVSRK